MDTPLANSARHDKLYVLAQCVGWGGFTLAYIGLAQLGRGLTLNDASIFVAANFSGWLLSHLYRHWIHRRGWRQLSGAALVPRVLIGALVLAVTWTVVTWPLYTYFDVGYEAKKLSATALFTYSVFNGMWIYSFWSLLYFGYHIADRFRRSELERAQLAAAVKEAELRALKSQVNPHFIFNALNSLRALIDEDPTRARQAVTQLANLLRYSLQSGHLETVPFEEELAIVNDYLALEQVRHEERLRLRLDVEPETHQLAVPPMLLQTLVENAVKYGIAGRPEGGEIAIVARCGPDGLWLQVFNPGTLDRPGHQPSEHGQSSTGVGLRNAAERLRLLFGEKAALKLRTFDAATVVAEARIPQPVARKTGLVAV
ncbi:MAG: sensor histidine kinase [Opitutales bacterium]